METINLERFSVKTEMPLPKKERLLPRHQPGEKFLKGPIPWVWLSKAARQPGHAFHIAIALWLIAGMEKRPVVALSPKLVRGMGVQRHTMYRGLAALERADLIHKVESHPGRNTIVEILEIPREQER